MIHMKPLPNIGERIVVHGMQQKAIVENVTWIESVNDWKIELDWGQFGKSRIWLHDENVVWFRHSSSN